MSQSDSIPSPGPTLTLAPAQPPHSATPTSRYSPPSPLAVRLWCAFVFFSCAAMLAVGLYLQPDPHGIGTHQQLHFPPCGLYYATGIPCPTCGCTTAVSYISHGHWAKAFLTQPFGASVGLLAILLAILALIGIVSGRWIGPSIFLLNWYWRSIFASALALLLAAWIFKILMIKFSHSG